MHSIFSIKRWMQMYSVGNIIFSVGNVLNLTFIQTSYLLLYLQDLINSVFSTFACLLQWLTIILFNYNASSIVLIVLLHVYYFFSYLQELIHSIFSTLFSSFTVLKYSFSSGPHTFNLLYFIGLINLTILHYLHLNLVALLHFCYL